MAAVTIAAPPIALAAKTWNWSSAVSLAVLCTVSFSISMFALRDILFGHVAPEERAARRRHGS
jgi:hypothetical protein